MIYGDVQQSTKHWCSPKYEVSNKRFLHDTIFYGHFSDNWNISRHFQIFQRSGHLAQSVACQWTVTKTAQVWHVHRGSLCDTAAFWHAELRMSEDVNDDRLRLDVVDKTLCDHHWELLTMHRQQTTDQLTDWVNVLRPSRHKTGHFRDVLRPEETKPNSKKQTQEQNNLS